MNEFPILRGPRLALRPFTLHDTTDLFTIRGDAQAMAYWDWPNDPDISATVSVAETFVEEMQAGSALYWTARTQDGTFCGVFDLSGLNGETDLGFMVPRALWGMGYGFEGASAVITEAWRRGLPGLNARIHEGNDRSARLLTRLCFVAAASAEPQEIRPGVIAPCRRFRLLGHRGPE